jgi:copper resistance protein B
MNRLALIGLAPFLVAAPALAQPMDHSSMPGMPAQGAAPATPGPHTGHETPSTPASPADPHAGHAMPPGASPMPGPPVPAATSGQPLMSQVEVPKSPPPPAPADHAADGFFAPEAMAAARAQLRLEHGAAPLSMVMANLVEYQARKGADGYRWEGQAWFGGDIDRLVLKSEGEGTRGDGVESAEIQALYSRAVGVYTDVQVGVRQDFEPHSRTYATVGFQTLLPYWFDVEGAAFLSNKGELLGRLEGSYDLRMTNRLILQPRAELNFAAQDTAATRTGSGLSNAELGLRLRYEIRREFAPYIGVSWDRRFGKTADYARALREDVVDKSVVFGVRAFF